MLPEMGSKLPTLVRVWNSLDLYPIGPVPRAFQGPTKCFRMKNSMDFKIRK